MLRWAPRLGRRRVWAAIALLVGLFALVPPLLSHDVYSYIDYARLGAVHHLNPYVQAPRAAPTDPVFADVDWRGVTSAYGPLFTLATYAVAGLSVGSSILVLKIVSALATVALVAIVARVAPSRGVDPVFAAAFVGLNPLVLVHVVGGPHNDVWAMVPAMLAVGAVLARTEAAGGAWFALAVAVKASAGFAAPFALIGAGRRGRFLVGGLLAAVPIAAVSTAAFGPHWVDGLGVATGNLDHTSQMSFPIRIAIWTGIDYDLARAVALVLFAALLAYLLAWTWRGGDWVRGATWAGLGLLLTTSWLLPWYLIWVLPLAAISRDRRAHLLLLAITAFQLGTRLPL